VNGFEAPVLCHQLASEPIEQLRVVGRSSLRAEIIFGFDNAAPEIFLPEAVDDDTRGEGIFGMSNPVGEIKASQHARAAVRLNVGLDAASLPPHPGPLPKGEGAR